MKTAASKLPAFAKGKAAVHVIIETPKSSRIKYAYDQKSGLLKVKRALPEGMAFPFNFGFIPGTLGEDGDPLDILILNEESLAAGCLLEARLIGLLKAKQTEDGKTTCNDRLIGVTSSKETPTELESIELTAKVCEEIEQFFVNYNQIDGKKFKVVSRSGPKAAKKKVKQGIAQAEKESK